MSIAHFHTLRVTDVRRETDQAVSIAFDIPDDLADAYRYVQGQHLTLRAHIDGEDVRRSYSICSGLDDGEIRVAIKHLQGGRFSTFANSDIQVGDEIDVMPPMGRFYTELDPTRSRHYLAFAAGSGITPILSILKTTLAREPDSRFTLVYANRNVGSIIFREQLDHLKNHYTDRLHLIHVLSRASRDVDLLNGRIDGEKVRAMSERLVPLHDVDEIFLCGPQSMIESVRETLTGALQFPAENVHFELFGTEQAPARPIPVAMADQGPMRKVTVIADGKKTTIDLSTEGSSILDAALGAGADLPFACKGGVCCTCRARLVEGEVKMDVNYALEPNEVEQGYILTCQSHPVTDHVTVDYDTI